MKKSIFFMGLCFLIFLMVPVVSGVNLLEKIKGPSDKQIAAGLKEALTIGTENAVKSTGRVDGYFGNAAIKIMLPDNLKKIEKPLRNLGAGPQVDEFVLSMNRAAEKAAPGAKKIFWDAIKEMTFSDARKILKGKDTEATEYFKEKTYEKLASAFTPVVTKAMDEVDVTRRYKELEKRSRSIPLIKIKTVDLDRYVVDKALDGLFYMLGEEEKKIRKDPLARVTKLLKEVFG